MTSSYIYCLLDTIKTLHISFDNSYIFIDKLRYFIKRYGNYRLIQNKDNFMYFKRKSGTIYKQIEKDNIEKGILSIDVHNQENKIISMYFRDIDSSIKINNNDKIITITNVNNINKDILIELIANKVNFKYQ